MIRNRPHAHPALWVGSSHGAEAFSKVRTDLEQQREYDPCLSRLQAVRDDDVFGFATNDASVSEREIMSDQQPHPSIAYGKVYKEETPDVVKAWADFNGAVFSEEREVPRKYLELIAVAVAVTTQCEFCIRAHTALAVKAGATDNELAEASWVAAALRAGGAFTHGRIAFQTADQHRH